MSDDCKKDLWDQVSEVLEEAVEKLEEAGRLIGRTGDQVLEETAEARAVIREKANEIRDVLVNRTSEAWREARRAESDEPQRSASDAPGREDETDEYPAYRPDTNGANTGEEA